MMLFGNEKDSDINDNNPFRYCGEYLDMETGSIYLRARYYDPEIGRFITEDSYEGKISNPLSLNLYTYCMNNPIYFIDPSGNDVLSATIPISTGLALFDGPLIIGDIIGGTLLASAAVYEGGLYIYDSFANNSSKTLVSKGSNNSPVAPKRPPNFKPLITALKVAKTAAKIDFAYKKIKEACREWADYLRNGGLSTNDRIAQINTTSKEVADTYGWVVNKRISKLNQRTVYWDANAELYYAVDTYHGTFEVCNSSGKHLGEVDYSLSSVDEPDKSKKHNLKIK